MEIGAATFKARCLQLMDEVARTGRSIVITKRGKPVARLIPVEKPAPPKPLWGYMAGTFEIAGDIVDVPQEEWSLLSGEESRIGHVAEPARKASSVSGKRAASRKAGR